MDENHQIRKIRFNAKIEELKNSLQAVKVLKNTSEPRLVDFELGDTLYSKALVEPTQKVHLWLSSSLMLEYDVEEALEVLEKKLSDAQKRVQEIEHDLAFIREQITTTELNVARIHNYIVSLKENK